MNEGKGLDFKNPKPTKYVLTKRNTMFHILPALMVMERKSFNMAKFTFFRHL